MIYKKTIVLLSVFIWIAFNFTFAAEIEATYFEDTTEHWASRYIRLLQKTDIIRGYPDRTFRPDNKIRVDEFLVLCIKSLNIEVEPEKDGDDWAKPYIDYGIRNELVDIGLGAFDRAITREEMARILVLTAEKSEEIDSLSEESLKDAIKDLPFVQERNKEYVVKAYLSGLMSGMPGNSFMPQVTATRAEASVVVLRLINKNERQPFLPVSKEEPKVFLSNTTAIPQYLQTRFDQIADKFNLTWTDKDFKAWYTTTSDEEKNKYFNLVVSPPQFDFDKKTASISKSTVLYGLQEDLRNLNDYNAIMPIKYFGYIAYEMYKRNIELLIKDGADFGKLHIAHALDNHALFIKVLDGERENRKSFQVIINTTNYELGSLYHHYLKDQWDRDLDTTHWTTWQEYVTPHVNNITRMNMYFIHGLETGQLIFDNYMAAFKQRMVVGLASKPDKNLDIETDTLTVHHVNDAGWWLLIREKK